MIFSKRGSFSIIGTIVTATISLGVVLLTTTVILRVSQDTAKINVQGQVDYLHLEGLHILSNHKYLKRLFLDQIPSVYLCFQGKGVGCRAFNGRVLSDIDPEKKILVTSYFGASGPCSKSNQIECPFLRSAKVQLDCSQEEWCERIEVSLQTTYNGTQPVRSQQTTRTLSSRTFDQRRNLDFKCVAGEKIISGIDFTNLNVKCEGLPNEKLNCPTALPLQGFGIFAPTGCHPSPVQGICGARGLSATSLSGGSHACTL